MAIEKLNNSKNNDDSGVLDMTLPPTDGGKTVTMAPTSEQKQPQRLKVTTSGGTRNKVSISDIAGEPETEVHGNPNISKVNKAADDMLDLTNPNSMFNRYYNDKVEEYGKRMEQEEERVRDAVEEGTLDRNSDIAKSWLGNPEDENKRYFTQEEITHHFVWMQKTRGACFQICSCVQILIIKSFEINKVIVYIYLGVGKTKYTFCLLNDWFCTWIRYSTCLYNRIYYFMHCF